MLLTSDHLDALADTGIFRPSRLNDERRIDLCGGQSFLAIDPLHPQEIDDAIRVQMRKGGGFTLQVAVADGSQVDPESTVFNKAVSQRFTIYKGFRAAKSMLPHMVVRELELRDSGPRRALVLSQNFSAETEPEGDADIYPATVDVSNLRHREFSNLYIRRLGKHAAGTPVIAFDRVFRERLALPYAAPESLGGNNDSEIFASRLVQTYMVLASMAAARWTTLHEVPILFRNFDPKVELANEEPYARDDRAYYTTEASGHTGVAEVVKEKPLYTHITSPLRRAADLINHIQVGHHLAGHATPFTTTDLAAYSDHLNGRSAGMAEAT